MSQAVRILIVDAYEPWRRVVYWFVNGCPGWQIVGEASDGVEGLQKAKELQPDLILLEVGLPKLNGIQTAKSIRSVAPNSKLLFVSVDLCPEIAQAALTTGAHGYVVKADAALDLSRAMRAVLNDERFVSSRVANPHFIKTNDK